MSTTTTINPRFQQDYDVVADIARRLDVDKTMADRLWNAMSEVYDILGETGKCDGAGGMEAERVIPDALDYIRHEANAGGSAPDPFEVLGWKR